MLPPHDRAKGGFAKAQLSRMRFARIKETRGPSHARETRATEPTQHNRTRPRDQFRCLQTRPQNHRHAPHERHPRGRAHKPSHRQTPRRQQRSAVGAIRLSDSAAHRQSRRHTNRESRRNTSMLQPRQIIKRLRPGRRPVSTRSPHQRLTCATQSARL